MFTYITLNIVVLAIIGAIFYKRATIPSRYWWLMITVLLLLTAIFDSLIIATGIVAYDTSKLLGIYIGIAPIEDFFYAILAAILIPLLWHKKDVNNA